MVVPEPVPETEEASEALVDGFERTGWMLEVIGDFISLILVGSDGMDSTTFGASGRGSLSS